jgi:hypothetical protein
LAEAPIKETVNRTRVTRLRIRCGFRARRIREYEKDGLQRKGSSSLSVRLSFYKMGWRMNEREQADNVEWNETM